MLPLGRLWWRIWNWKRLIDIEHVFLCWQTSFFILSFFFKFRFNEFVLSILYLYIIDDSKNIRFEKCNYFFGSFWKMLFHVFKETYTQKQVYLTSFKANRKEAENVGLYISYQIKIATCYQLIYWLGCNVSFFLQVRLPQIWIKVMINP